MTAERSVTVKLKIDNSDFIRGLGQASAAAEAFKRSLGGKSASFARDLDKTTTSLHKFSDETSSAGKNVLFLGRGVGDVSHGVHEFSDTLDEAGTSAGRMSAATRKMAASQDEYRRASERVSAALHDADDENRSFIAGLNTSSNRMAFLVQSALALGPALVPTLAASVPLVAGLGVELGIAAGATGVAILAFQGVGKALTAMNTQAIQPTDAHLEALRVAMAQLGPVAQDFVRFLQELRPVMSDLQEIAQAGIFPGVEDGISALMTQLPTFERLLQAVSGAMGEIAGDAGRALSGPFFTDFANFLTANAPRILSETASAVGNLVKGFLSLTMALQPLTDDFAKGFQGMAQSFANWADQLSGTQGFQDFLAFVRTAGPEVLDVLGSIGNAFVQLSQAASGIGLASLQILQGLFDSIAVIADSPLGPPLIALAAGITAVSRALALMKTVGTSAFVGNIQSLSVASRQARLGVGALGLGLGVLSTGIDDSNETMKGLVNTASLAATGFAVGGPWGAAIGGSVGLLTSLTHSTDAASAATAALNAEAERLAATLNQKTGEQTVATVKDIATELQKAGADADAVDLGIPFEKIVEAAAGSETAIAQVRTQMRAAVAEARAQRDAIQASIDASPTVATPEQQAALNAANNSLINLEFAAKGVRATISGQNEAVAKAVQVWKDGRAASQAAASALRDLKGAAQDEDQEILKLIADHNALADTLLSASDSAIAFRSAIRDALEGAKGFEGSIFSGTKAADEQRTALNKAAEAWNAQTTAAQSTPGAYREARKDFLKVADAMNVGAVRANRMADSLLDLPDPAKRAAIAAKQLADQYNKLPRDVRLKVSALGADATKAQVDDLLDSLDLTEKERKIILSVIDHASGPIDDVQAKADDLDGTRATVRVFADITSALSRINTLFSVITTPQTVSVSQTTSGPAVPDRQHRARGGISRSARVTDRPILWGEAGPESYIPLVSRSDPRWGGAVDILRQSADALGIATAAAGKGPGRSIGAGELSRRAARSDDPLNLSDLVDALKEMRREAEDVTEAEKDLKAAREASKNASKQVSKTEKELEKARSDGNKAQVQQIQERLKAQKEAQRAADKDLTRAEKELSDQRDELASATDRWREAQQKLIDQAIAVQQSILSQGGVLEGPTSVTAGGILAKIRKAAKDAAEFDRNIAILRARGLDEDIIQQLLQEAGTPAANAAAKNLAEASKREIAKINAAQSHLEHVALRAGQTAVTGGGGGTTVNATFTGDITTTDVTRLPKQIERRVLRAVRRARRR